MKPEPLKVKLLEKAWAKLKKDMGLVSSDEYNLGSLEETFKEGWLARKNAEKTAVEWAKSKTKLLIKNKDREIMEQILDEGFEDIK